MISNILPVIRMLKRRSRQTMSMSSSVTQFSMVRLSSPIYYSILFEHFMSNRNICS